jgi:hypothetical protein
MLEYIFREHTSKHKITHYIIKTFWLTSWQDTYSNRHLLTEEKLGEIGTNLGHTPQKSLRHTAQETDISKLSETIATKLQPFEDEACLNVI